MLPGANIQEAIARLRQQQMQGGKVGFGGMGGGMDQLGGGGGMPFQGGDPMAPGGGLQGMAMPVGLGGAGGNMGSGGQIPPASSFEPHLIASLANPPAQVQQWQGGGQQTPPFMFHGNGGNATGPSMAPQGPGPSSMQPMAGPGESKAPSVQTRPAIQPRPARAPTGSMPNPGAKPVKPGVAQQQARVGGLVSQIADFKPQAPGGATPLAAPSISDPNSKEEARKARANIAAARPRTQ